jgi:hypothetical protein
MAGTINLALTQQFDMDGVPLSGGQLRFFIAGSTTPQPAFQDLGLTIPFPNPIVLDASGRVPMFYLADGFIKIRLTDKNGVIVISADQLLVIGPSSGGSSAGSGVTPSALMATGDIKARYETIAIDGYVRCNGQSIGKTGSGASERADTDDCRALFNHLWQFGNITLDAPKGGSGNADFDAGRKLNLPDLRGRVIAGLDDMGASSPSGRLTTNGLGVSPIVLGNAGHPLASDILNLADIHLPLHTHTQTGTHVGTVTEGSGIYGTGGHIGVPGNTGGHHTHSASVSGTTDNIPTTLSHAHGLPNLTVSTFGTFAGGGSLGGVTGVAYAGSFGGSNTNTQDVNHTHTFSSTSGSTGDEVGDHAHNVNVDLGAMSPKAKTSTPLSGNTGDGSGTFQAAPFSKVQPTMVLTFYMKL